MSQEFPSSDDVTILKKLLEGQSIILEKISECEKSTQAVKKILEKKTPKQIDQEHFLRSWIEDKGYICFSEAKMHPRFDELFTSESQFHRTARAVKGAHGCKVMDQDRRTYYCRADFVSERILNVPRTKVSAQNPQFIKQLALFIREKVRVNVYEYLEKEYPWLNGDQKADILEELEKAKRHGVTIKREGKTDWFSRWED